MRIATKAYGTIEIDERQCISFPGGLLGFEQFHNFALIDAAQRPFYWLQSLDSVEIAFVMINPTVFRPDYKPDCAPEDTEDLETGEREDLLVFAIVNIPDNQNHMTANLQGPVLINRRTRMGKQCISLNPAWKIKHMILEELGALKAAPC